MIRVTHVVGALRVGGAETALSRLLSRLPRDEFSAHVIGMGRLGPMAAEFEAQGAEVQALELSRRWPSPARLLRLRRWIRDSRPDLVETWTYEADLLAGMAARTATRAPVIWRLHRSLRNLSLTRLSTRLAERGCMLASHAVPSRIVSCSEAGLDMHEMRGYPRRRMLVIPNGYDLDAFRPDDGAPEAVRRELGIPLRAPLVGLFARWSPQKDLPTFFAAAGLLLARMPSVHFVLAGEGLTPENAGLWRLMTEADAQLHAHLLGMRHDVARLMAACDLVTTSSAFGEAFPQVVGEAMACAVPCVVTDVGDSAHVVGETGRVVRPRHPPQLARAWEEMLQLSWQRLRERGREARHRVEVHFELGRVAARWAALYRELVAESRARAARR